MKRINVFLIVLIFVGSIIGGCKKDDDTVTTKDEPVTNDEAAEVIAQSIGADSGGAGFMMTDATQMSKTGYTAEKDALADSTFTITNTVGDLSYNLSMSYSWNITMNTSERRMELNLSFTTDGTVTGSRINSNGSSAGNYTIYGLMENDPYYVLTGTYKRTGSTTVKIVEEKTLTSVVDITFTEINYDKTTFKVKNGTATVSFTGTTAKGETFSATGTITYSDDGTAVLTIGDDTYTLNIQEGTVNK